MNDLEMSKAIAKLEGVETHMCGNVECEENLYSDNGGYWPITDLALNCMLSDKYEVSVDHPVGYVYITQGWKDIEVYFETKEDLPRARIECILKSKGLYIKSNNSKGE